MQPEALRLTYIWIVHSDIDENNLYSEFGSEAQALDYARRHADDLTWVEKVEVAVDESDEIVEYHDGETIWVYLDDESTDSRNQQPQMEELEDDDEEETVECQDCGTIVNKSDCLKTDGGTYVCKYCQEDFDNLVETLEENEDIVECKECFELFPKSDCIKLDVGYICPTCHQHYEDPECHEFDLDDIAYVELDDDLVFKIDFPELERLNYGNDMIPDESTPEIENGLLSDPEPMPEVGPNPEPLVEPCVDPECATPIEPPVTKDETITKLVIDEHEAIEGYEQARIEIEENSGLDEKEKEEILDTIEHIKEEEVEHIEELEELVVPKDEEPVEDSNKETKILTEDKWFQKLLRGATQLFKGNASAEAMADVIFGKDENNKNKPLFIVEFYKERTKIKDDDGKEKAVLVSDTSVAGGKGVAKYASFEAAKNAAEKYVKIRKTHEVVIRPVEDPNDLVEKTASGKFKALQYYADGTLSSNVLEDNIIPEYKEKLKKAKEEEEAAEAAKKKAEEEDRKVKDFNAGTIDDERLIDDDEIEAVKNNLPATYEIEDASKLAVLVRALSNKEITKENVEALLKDRVKELKKFGLKQKETTAPAETNSVFNKSPDDLEDEQQPEEDQSTTSVTNDQENQEVADTTTTATTVKPRNAAAVKANKEYKKIIDALKKIGIANSEIAKLIQGKKPTDALKELRKLLFVESLEEHVNEEHPAIESDQELEGTDNAVVDCEVADIITHSEDEKPLDCKMEKAPLEKPLAGEEVDTKLYEEKELNEIFGLSTKEKAQKIIDTAKPLNEYVKNYNVTVFKGSDNNTKFFNNLQDAANYIATLKPQHADTISLNIDELIDQTIKTIDLIEIQKSAEGDARYFSDLNKKALVWEKGKLTKNNVAVLVKILPELIKLAKEAKGSKPNTQQYKDSGNPNDMNSKDYNRAGGWDDQYIAGQHANGAIDDSLHISSKEDILNEDLSEVEDRLIEDTHAQYAKPEGNRIAAYNNALIYAKEYGVPYIYGYTQRGDGKFFALEQPIKVKGGDTRTAGQEFRNQYKRCSTVYMVYPDKDFITEELFTKAEQEEYNMDEEGYSLDSHDQYVRCGWCGEIFTKYECVFEKDFGWLCGRCQDELKNSGGRLDIIVNPTEEDIKNAENNK